MHLFQSKVLSNVAYICNARIRTIHPMNQTYLSPLKAAVAETSKPTGGCSCNSPHNIHVKIKRMDKTSTHTQTVCNRPAQGAHWGCVNKYMLTTLDPNLEWCQIREQIVHMNRFFLMIRLNRFSNEYIFYMKSSWFFSRVSWKLLNKVWIKWLTN